VRHSFGALAARVTRRAGTLVDADRAAPVASNRGDYVEALFTGRRC